MAASIETVVTVTLESDKDNADTDKDAATATPSKKEKALTKILRQLCSRVCLGNEKQKRSISFLL